MNHKYFCSVLFLLFSISITAQPYLTDSAKWYEFSGDYNSGYLQISKYEVSGDTVVGGTEYKTIIEKFDYYYWGIFGGDTTVTENINTLHFVREDATAFYRWTPSGEKQIIRFDYGIGDTIFVPGWEDEVVTEIETFDIAGEGRKIFYTNYGSKVYEGIGTNSGLINGLDFIGEEYFSVLKCFSLNDETIEIFPSNWDYSQVQPCDEVVFTPTHIRPEKERILSVFPNPFYDKIFLANIADGNNIFQLINPAGQIIKRWEIANMETAVLEIQNIPPGIYFLINKNNNVVESRKLVRGF